MGLFGSLVSAAVKSVASSRSTSTYKPRNNGTKTRPNYNSNTDYSSIIYDQNTSKEQKQAAYNARTEKERAMRAAGTWNNSWMPTSELQSVINSSYYGNPYADFPSAQPPDSYMDVQEEQNRLASEREELARQLYENQVRQGTDRLNAQRDNVNRTYDDASRQAYISYMQNQRAIPGQLANAGITGGAAESTMLGAQTAYQDSVGSIGVAKQKAMQDIDMAVTELQNSGDVESAQYILANREKIADNFAQNAYAEIARNDNLKQLSREEERYAKDDAYRESALTGMYNGKPTYDARQDSYQKAMEFGMLTGDFSWLKQFGYTDEQIKAARRAYLEQKAYGSSGGGAGRGGSRRGGKRKKSSGGGGSSTYTPYAPAQDARPRFTKDYDMASITALGMGPIDLPSLEQLIKSGKIGVKQEGGKIKVYRIDKGNTTPPSKSPFPNLKFR